MNNDDKNNLNLRSICKDKFIAFGNIKVSFKNEKGDILDAVQDDMLISINDDSYFYIYSLYLGIFSYDNSLEKAKKIITDSIFANFFQKLEEKPLLNNISSPLDEVYFTTFKKMKSIYIENKLNKNLNNFFSTEFITVQKQPDIFNIKTISVRFEEYPLELAS